MVGLLPKNTTRVSTLESSSSQPDLRNSSGEGVDVWILVRLSNMKSSTKDASRGIFVNEDAVILRPCADVR